MVNLILTIVFAILAFASLIISIIQFKEKGVPFNNAYILTSQEERETMNLKPYYRQSAIAFAFITAIFSLMAIAFIVKAYWLWSAVIGLSVAALIYAIASTVKIDKNY